MNHSSANPPKPGRGAEITVANNATAGQFEIRADEGLAFLAYSVSGGVLHLVHTEVPSALEGRGYGSQLAKAGLEYARREGLRVAPDCAFVRGYVERHPEFASLVDRGGR